MTVYWLKPLIDKKFLIFQLKENYKHEQAKKIKETIGQYKNHILTSAEMLNNRLKNFAKYQDKNWIKVSGDYHNNHHYIDTTVYRFLSFFANIKLIEDNLEYLDTTNSDSKDMEMIRYFRIFTDIITDAQLFESTDYDANFQTDHFFRNRFEQYVTSIIREKKVLSYDQFEESKTELLQYIKPVYEFFDGMNKSEMRFRLERMKSFHCLLVSFLNHFGYDFQKTELTKIQELKSSMNPIKFPNETLEIVNKYKLKESKQAVEIIINNYK